MQDLSFLDKHYNQNSANLSGSQSYGLFKDLERINGLKDNQMSGMDELFKNFSFKDLGSLLEGFGAVGGMFNGIKQSRLAEDLLRFKKQAYQTSLGDQRQTYNTALEDQARARHITEGRPQDTAGYVAKNKLG